MESTFQRPLQLRNPSGNMRRAGFEFEYAGVDLQTAANIVTDLFGGEIRQRHDYRIDIPKTDLGQFRIELDSNLLKRYAKSVNARDDASASATDSGFSMEQSFKKAVLWAGEALHGLVPFEIVSPPIPIDRFDQMEALRQSLQDLSAQGTRESLWHAFGLHINPEIPSGSASSVLSYLQSFLILYPWLLKACDVDVSRRILSFIDPFPKKYIRHVLNQNYHPDLQQLADDYIDYNPTRNRALDLLPLFAELTESSLSALDPQMREKVKARPAYHYRLPNCDIGNEHWTLAQEWNRWIVIEELAADTRKRQAMAQNYLQALEGDGPDDWPQYVEEEYAPARRLVHKPKKGGRLKAAQSASR